MPNDPKDPLDAHHQAASKLYDGSNATPLPERKGEFYAYDHAEETVKQRGNELFTQKGMTAAETQQLGETFRGIRKATGLPDGLVATIADAHVSALLADEGIPDDPDIDLTERAQRVAADTVEARERLVGLYGPKDGPALLKRTEAYVRAHPALAKILREHGLGSRPDIVEGIADHVRITGWRG
jgi:hypothetical protein